MQPRVCDTNRNRAISRSTPEQIRLGTIIAQAEAAAAEIRAISRWRPGTLSALLADLPGEARLDQLCGPLPRGGR